MLVCNGGLLRWFALGFHLVVATELFRCRLIDRVMMYAEIHGNNQGISKLYRPQDMGFNPKAGPLLFENETKLSCRKSPQSPPSFDVGWFGGGADSLPAVVNGNQRAGMVALEAAVDKAIEKASQHGMAVTGTYNTCTSTGMLAYYSSRWSIPATAVESSPKLSSPSLTQTFLPLTRVRQGALS